MRVFEDIFQLLIDAKDESRPCDDSIFALSIHIHANVRNIYNGV